MWTIPSSIKLTEIGHRFGSSIKNAVPFISGYSCMNFETHKKNRINWNSKQNNNARLLEWLSEKINWGPPHGLIASKIIIENDRSTFESNVRRCLYHFFLPPQTHWNLWNELLKLNARKLGHICILWVCVVCEHEHNVLWQSNNCELRPNIGQTQKLLAIFFVHDSSFRSNERHKYQIWKGYEWSSLTANTYFIWSKNVLRNTFFFAEMRCVGRKGKSVANAYWSYLLFTW